MTLNEYYLNTIKSHPNLDVVSFLSEEKDTDTVFVGVAGNSTFAESAVCQKLIELGETVVDPNYFQVLVDFLSIQYNPFVEEFNNTKFRNKSLSIFPDDVYGWVTNKQFGEFTSSKSRMEFFAKQLVDPFIEWLLLQNKKIESDVVYVNLPRGSFTYTSMSKILWIDCDKTLADEITVAYNIPNSEVMNNWMTGFVKPHATSSYIVGALSDIPNIAEEILNGTN